VSQAADLRPSPGRVPPHDLDAEAVVISSVLLDPDTFGDLSMVIRSEHFYADANRRIWDAIAALSSVGRQPDAPAVAGWLRDHQRLDQVGGMAYLAQLADGTPAAAKPIQYARRVIAKWRLRALIGTCQRIAAEAYGTVEDIGEFIQQAESAIYEVAQDESRSSRSATGKEVMVEVLKELDAKFNQKQLPGGSTGFETLDRRIGWLRGGRVYIVAARPGMGKTSFVSRAGKAVMLSDSANKGFFFASVEMPRDQIGSRLLAQEAVLDTRAVDAGFLTGAQVKDLHDRAEEIAKWPMVIDDTPAVTIPQLRSILRRAERRLRDEFQTGLGLVAIDYAQIMGKDTRNRNASMNDMTAAVSAGVLAIAKEFSVPVLLLAQLNRDCEKRPDKRPMLADLRDSGAFEQDAHTVIFIYRDDPYKKQGETPDGTAELIVAKARGGRCGTVHLDFVAKSALFVDKASDDPDDEFAKFAADLGDHFDVNNLQDPGCE
jgi:replicative DNA helicase